MNDLELNELPRQYYGDRLVKQNAKYFDELSTNTDPLSLMYTAILRNHNRYKLNNCKNIIF